MACAAIETWARNTGVFSPEGLPLLVSREADIEEFRRLVRNAPGRYRLDAVTEEQTACEDALPAYINIEDVAMVESTAAVVAAPHDDLLRTVIAANTEMVRCMSEKFANVMEAAATLLRAADGAGMPRRDVRNALPAPSPPEPTVIEVERDDGDGELAAILKSAVDTVMPLVGHTINTKVLGLSSDQSLALLGGSSSEQPRALAGPAPDESSAPEHGDDFDEEADTEPRGRTLEATDATELPQRDFVAHLRAVEALLAPKEVAMVRTAVTQMKPETLLAWRERLLSLDPPGAAAVVRAEIYKGELK